MAPTTKDAVDSGKNSPTVATNDNNTSTTSSQDNPKKHRTRNLGRRKHLRNRRKIVRKKKDHDSKETKAPSAPADNNAIISHTDSDSKKPKNTTTTTTTTTSSVSNTTPKDKNQKDATHTTSSSQASEANTTSTSTSTTTTTSTRSSAPKKKLFFKTAIAHVLKNARKLLTPSQIWDHIEKEDLVATAGKTPRNTISSILSTELLKRGKNSKFVKFEPSYFGLRELMDCYDTTDLIESKLSSEPPRGLMTIDSSDGTTRRGRGRPRKSDRLVSASEGDSPLSISQRLQNTYKRKKGTKYDSSSSSRFRISRKRRRSQLEENGGVSHGDSDNEVLEFNPSSDPRTKRPRHAPPSHSTLAQLTTTLQKRKQRPSLSIVIKRGESSAITESSSSSSATDSATPFTANSLPTPSGTPLPAPSPSPSPMLSEHHLDQNSRSTLNTLKKEHYYILKELRLFNYNHRKAVHCEPTLKLRDGADVVYMDEESGIRVVQQDNQGYGVEFTEYIEKTRTYAYSGWMDSIKNNNSIDETYVLQMDNSTHGDAQSKYSVLGLDVESKIPFPSGRVNHACCPAIVSYGVVKYEGLHIPVIQTRCRTVPGMPCVTNYEWKFEKSGDFTKCYCDTIYCGGFIEQNLTRTIVSLASNLRVYRLERKQLEFMEKYSQRPDLLLQYFFTLKLSEISHSLVLLGLYHCHYQLKLPKEKLNQYLFRLVESPSLNFLRDSFDNDWEGLIRFTSVWNHLHTLLQSKYGEDTLMGLNFSSCESLLHVHRYSEGVPFDSVRELIKFCGWVSEDKWTEFRDQCALFLQRQMEQQTCEELLHRVDDNEDEYLDWAIREEEEAEEQRRKEMTFTLRLS